jgi:uncharacterized protein (DUF58 family)
MRDDEPAARDYRHATQRAVVLLLNASPWMMKDTLSRLLDKQPVEVLTALADAHEAEAAMLAALQQEGLSKPGTSEKGQS